MPEGLLSGLGGIIGKGLLGGTGITAGRRAEATRKAALLKQGLDPSRMRDEAYVSAQANRTPTADIKGEFGYAMSVINSPDFKTQYTPEQQAQFIDFANTKAKGLDTLRNQTTATVEPKLQLEQQYKPVTKGLEEQATQDVKAATEPSIQADIVTSKGEAQSAVERAKAVRQADIDFSSMSKGIDDLEAQLDANPDLVGAYSEIKTQLGKYTPLGFSDEKLEARGELANSVGIMGFQMLKYATEAGLSGINTVAEAKRAIGNLTKDSSAQEIKGAMKALKRARNDMLVEMKRREQGGSAPQEGQTDLVEKYGNI